MDEMATVLAMTMKYVSADESAVRMRAETVLYVSLCPEITAAKLWPRCGAATPQNAASTKVFAYNSELATVASRDGAKI